MKNGFYARCATVNRMDSICLLLSDCLLRRAS